MISLLELDEMKNPATQEMFDKFNAEVRDFARSAVSKADLREFIESKKVIYGHELKKIGAGATSILLFNQSVSEFFKSCLSE